MGKKHTYEYVKQFFKNAGCELLENEYIGNKIRMNYICICTEKSTISFGDFANGGRCMNCGIKKCADKKKLTIEEVKLLFKEGNCELLETEYINSLTPMNYICECGTESKINVGSFKRGGRCKKCGLKKISSKLRLSFTEVSNFFLEKGCSLLEESYVNSQTPMSYICECGIESKISYSSFKAGHRCYECGIEKIKQDKKFSYDYIKEEFSKRGFILLETTYTNAITKMNYICSCGNESIITYSTFSYGGGCHECGYKKIAESKMFTYAYVFETFEKDGCKLIDKEYNGIHIPLNYICNCGRESKICFGSFQAGNRCKDCGYEKISGANNYRWLGGRSSLNSFLRSKLQDWKHKSIVDCSYKCSITNINIKKGNFEVHHLCAFDKIVENVMDTLKYPFFQKVEMYTDEQLINIELEVIKEHNKLLGVCLLKYIHEFFHHIYGSGGNTPEQFYEFKERYNSGEFFIEEAI